MTPGASQPDQHSVSTPLQVQPCSPEQLRASADRGFLYAILDATDCPAVPQMARKLGEGRAVSLFRGTVEEPFWEVAPYLTQIDQELLDWILRERTEDSWGIFAVSNSSLEELRRHFRRLLVVQLPDRTKWYFRYYDPRILNTFLSTNETEDLNRFFGPVRGFVLAQGSRLSMCYLPSTHTQASAPPAIFQVSTEQLQILDRIAEVDFVERMVQHVCELFPEETHGVPRQQMLGSISKWTREAGRWGLTDEPEVEQWIELCVCHSEIRHASETSWVVEVLSYPGRSAAHKLERLQQRLIFSEA